MMSNRANRAVLYLILGFVAANLALAMRMNATATFRQEMVDDLNHTNEQLERIEGNQQVYMDRQLRALEKLGVDTKP